MTDSLCTAIKHVVMSFEPQWMFRRRLTKVIADKANGFYKNAGVDIDVRSFFGKEINNTKEWNRLVNASREMIEAMATVGGHANEDDQQEVMGKWIADVVKIGNRAADIMSMLYPDQKDAPWRN